MPPKRDKRPSAEPWYPTASGNVWKRWGRTPCYNSRREIRPDALHCHKPCRAAWSEKKVAAGKKSAWIAALHEYNKRNTTWCVPRQHMTVNGEEVETPGYKACMMIKDRIEKERFRRKIGSPPPLEEVRPRAPRTPTPRPRDLVYPSTVTTRAQALRSVMEEAPRGGNVARRLDFTDGGVDPRNRNFAAGAGSSSGPGTAQFSERKTRSGRGFG